MHPCLLVQWTHLNARKYYSSLTDPKVRYGTIYTNHKRLKIASHDAVSYFNAVDDNVSYSLRSIWCHEIFFSPDRVERPLLEQIS
jgi:hypothetical protein